MGHLTSFSKILTKISVRMKDINIMSFRKAWKIYRTQVRLTLSQKESLCHFSDSHHVNIKITELSETPNSLSVHKIIMFVAKGAEEEWILRHPGVVHGDPDGHAGLADHAVLGHLAAQGPDQGIVRGLLRVPGAEQPHVYEGD